MEGDNGDGRGAGEGDGGGVGGACGNGYILRDGFDIGRLGVRRTRQSHHGVTHCRPRVELSTFSMDTFITVVSDKT